MDERRGGVGRRYFFQMLGVGLTTGVAGCSSLMATDDSPASSEQPTPNTTATEADSPAVAIELSTTSQPSQLPPIWDGHDISAFQARFSVDTSGQPAQITLANERVELTRRSEQWTDNTVTVEPGQLTPGEQTFTATATRGGGQAQATVQVRKPTPDAYKLDVVPQRNEELRGTIAEKADEDNYLQQRGGFVTSDPTLDTYSSHRQLAFDKFGVDLVALEWFHDNDYEAIEAASPGESAAFIGILANETGNETVERIKNGNEGIAWYPATGSYENRDSGHFDYELFSTASTLGEALDHLHPLFFNWQYELSEDGGPISSEDAEYAPILEQAIEQKNANIQGVHAWDVGLSGSTHGNGLIYGKNADGSEELRVMETIVDPVTSEGLRDPEWHPLVEVSGYLTPGNDGYERYWHPLRFGWEGHTGNYQNFRTRKRIASGWLINAMASSAESNYPEDTDFERTVPTTGYLESFCEKLRNFNENGIEFGMLYNQANIFHELIKNQENNHIVYGDVANPQYAVVGDDSVIDMLWEDRTGEYEDFDQFLKQNSATT
jgi:hypothetical protein